MLGNRKAAATNSVPGDTNVTTEGVDRLAASAHSGIHAAAEAVHPAIDRLASGAHRAVNSADEAANQATDAMARAGSKAGVKGEELYAAGAVYLREHPLLTIGVAVATGYLLSRLLATR
jgi:ElaB/YqjD/DUF883 family membrane-anchored ribosome-binding protein